MRWSHGAFRRWILGVLAALVTLAGLYVAALAFPRPLFAHTERFGEFSVYASQPLPADFERTIADARRRVAAMEGARPGVPHRVFMCGDQRLYSIFAILTRRSANSLGIGLSALRTIYLNESKLRRMIAAGGRPRHSRFEGNPSEVIAHEIAHFNAIRILGLRPAISLPAWKSEGYAEYQANLAAARADSAYTVEDRIALLLDDGFWAGSARARRLFEWQVLVEFLGEIEGLGLQQLADEGLTESRARNRMLAWYDARVSLQ